MPLFHGQEPRTQVPVKHDFSGSSGSSKISRGIADRSKGHEKSLLQKIAAAAAGALAGAAALTAGSRA
ncbi:MAG: hypothetical protein WDW38_000652 [Sanguina aurantia]